MRVLAKKDLLNKALKATGEKFGEYVQELGYNGYSYEILESPRMSNRGLLRARGNFNGPSPYGDTSRPIEDEFGYSFFVVEDRDHKHLLMLEVKLNSAMIAKFKILPKGIYAIDGELPHA
jgi:hypothetical protein